MAAFITSFGAQALAIVSLPFYFEDRLGHSASTSGLLLTPWPLATALIAPFFAAMVFVARFVLVFVLAVLAFAI
jgi:DHA2 family multidrug resistance protein-like MFS transporter